MDFKTFINESSKRATENEPGNETVARKTAESYKNKSDSELLSDILKIAGEQKANGSLNDEKLTAFAENVAPMLNDDQKARLNGVLELLKRNN